MKITSSDFKDNEMMPKKHTGYVEDLSPELILEDIPEDAASLAIIMEDLDVPFVRGEFTHWIIWNIPPMAVIPQRIPKGEVINTPINAVQGKAWGKHVYRGPKPPSFMKKPHRYRFTVYALDGMLELESDANKEMLVQAMAGHVIEKAEIVGLYLSMK